MNMEKRNYVNKNITLLKEEQDHIIFDSSKILTLQRQIYQDLYSLKENIPVRNSKYSDMLANLPKKI